MALPVTRVEIADHIAGAFGRGPVTRDDLIREAVRTGARDAVIRLLRRVPAGPFRDMRQIWPALPGVPVEPEAPERVEG
jgi:hypothetical protein